jgi:hypothetical protein
MSACSNCGTVYQELDPPGPPPSHCGACPPRLCDQCGEMDSHAQPCPCWVSLEGMPLADLKALFAGSDLGLELPREEQP